MVNLVIHNILTHYKSVIELDYNWITRFTIMVINKMMYCNPCNPHKKHLTILTGNKLTAICQFFGLHLLCDV